MKYLNYGMATLVLIVVGLVQCSNNSKKSNWAWLFHDTSIAAWRSTHGNEFPEQGWKVGENELTVLAATGTTPAGTDIITKDQFSNFELELEIKLTEGANSGIKYFVSDQYQGKKGKYLGLEYQLIDDEKHADAKLGKDGNRTMASLYDLIPASKDKHVNPPGTWNKIRIMVNGAHVQHWLNGEKVLEYNRESESFRELLSQSKYKDYENFGQLPQGHILLQGHKDEVAFRSIRIRTW